MISARGRTPDILSRACTLASFLYERDLFVPYREEEEKGRKNCPRFLSISWKTTVPAEVRARMKTNENESRRNPKKMFTRAQEDKYTTIIITYTTRRYALYSPRAASIHDTPPMRFSRWTIPCLHRQQQQYACTLWRIYTRTHPITLLEIEVRCLIYHVRS